MVVVGLGYRSDRNMPIFKVLYVFVKLGPDGARSTGRKFLGISFNAARAKHFPRKGSGIIAPSLSVPLSLMVNIIFDSWESIHHQIKEEPSLLHRINWGNRFSGSLCLEI
jgi:hypothetical protein